MSRLVALLLAATLVVGALFVRERLEARAGAPATPDEAVLLCIQELEDVCEAIAEQASGRLTLQAETTAAWATVELLGAEEDVEAAAWLTVDPFPELVAERRRRGGLEPLSAAQAPPVLARSPLVLAVWDDRAAALEGHCGGAIDWSCLGGVAGRPWTEAGGDGTWGPVKPGFADPTAAAEGSLVLAQAAVSELGAAPSRRALEEPAFFGWFTELQRAVARTRPAGGTPLAALPLTQRADYDVVGTTEAAAVELLERSGTRVPGLTIRPSEPIMTADVVVTPIGEAGDMVSEQVGEIAPAILVDHGWRVEGRVPSGGLTGVSPPEAAGPPPPGGLEALRTVWSEVRG